MTDSLEVISARRAAPLLNADDYDVATWCGGRRAEAVAARSFLTIRHLAVSSSVSKPRVQPKRCEEFTTTGDTAERLAACGVRRVAESASY